MRPLSIKFHWPKRAGVAPLHTHTHHLVRPDLICHYWKNIGILRLYFINEAFWTSQHNQLRNIKRIFYILKFSGLIFNALDSFLSGRKIYRNNIFSVFLACVASHTATLVWGRFDTVLQNNVVQCFSDLWDVVPA